MTADPYADELYKLNVTIEAIDSWWSAPRKAGAAMVRAYRDATVVQVQTGTLSRDAGAVSFRAIAGAARTTFFDSGGKLKEDLGDLVQFKRQAAAAPGIATEVAAGAAQRLTTGFALFGLSGLALIGVAAVVAVLVLRGRS